MARVSCSAEDDDITAQMAQRHEDAVKRLHDSIAQVSIVRGDLKFPPVRDHGVGSRATLASSTTCGMVERNQDVATLANSN